MQLFYELKQNFPTVPDQVVSELMKQVNQYRHYNSSSCTNSYTLFVMVFCNHSFTYPLLFLGNTFIANYLSII